MLKCKFLNEKLFLRNLTLETGGVPIRSIVVSTWRSGSTYFGRILSAMAQDFYFYEPLLPFGIKQIKDLEENERALDCLRKLMKCEFDDVEIYMNFIINHPFSIIANSKLWSYCVAFPSYCDDPEFLQRFCKLFPLQSMKILRIRLKIAADFLRDLRCETS